MCISRQGSHNTHIHSVTDGFFSPKIMTWLFLQQNQGGKYTVPSGFSCTLLHTLSRNVFLHDRRTDVPGKRNHLLRSIWCLLETKELTQEKREGVEWSSGGFLESCQGNILFIFFSPFSCLWPDGKFNNGPRVTMVNNNSGDKRLLTPTLNHWPGERRLPIGWCD